MYIFIDESGIHKLTDDSTVVLAYVKIDDYPAIEDKVQTLEKQLGIETFHWAHTIWKVKKLFMDKVLSLPFSVKLAVIKNPVNIGKQLEKLLAHMIIEHGVYTVFLDGKKPKWYEKRIKKVLRDKGVSINKLKSVKDSQVAGIRIADMVAGLSRSYFDGKNLKEIKPYFERLQSKVILTFHEDN